MSNQFVRGMGVLEKRIASVEGFLSGYRHERVTVTDSFGLPLALDVISKRAGRPNAKETPFMPTLFGTDANTYYVTVSDGKVNERDLKRGVGENAMLPPFECPNRMDGDEPRKFPIKVGESIYVAVYELPTGSIGNANGEPVNLKVEKTGSKSLNYIPGLQPGVYFYELAKCVLKDGVVVLEIVLAGSNVFHTSGLTGDFRIMTCHTPPAQLGRLRFTSGVMVAMGEAVGAVPLSPVVHDVSVEHCT